MAISLGFGVLFATFITLLLVPALYGIVEDGKHALSSLARFVKDDDPDDSQEPRATQPAR
jgi:hypothetical protein